MKKVSKKKSSSPAATKADLTKLETAIKAELAQMARKSDLEQMARKSDLDKFALKMDLDKFALKTDFVQMESRLMQKMDLKTDALKSELIDQMRFLNEQLLYDFRGIFSDKVAQQNDRIDDHERRLLRVEHKVGMAA